MFQRDVFGFRDQPQRQQDKQHVQTAVHPEGIGAAQRVEHGQEGGADNHVGNPVGRCGAGDTEVAAFQRLDFGAQYPNQRAGAHGETDDEHQQHQDGDVLGGRGVNADVHHGTQDAHTRGHHDKAKDQRRFTAPAVDQTDGDKGGQHVSQTDDHCPPHLLSGVGITRQLKDLRRVVHDDVHPGELLHHLQQDAEEHRAAEVAVVFKQRPAGLFYLQAFTDFIELAFRFGAGIAQAQQHAFRIDKATFGGEPARAVRQEDNADQQQYRRNDDNPEHPAPCAAVAESGVREIGAKDPDGDHQLVHGNHTAANFFWGDFRQIQRSRI